MLRVFSFANNILDCEVSQEKQKKFLESFQKKCENKTDDLIIVIGSKNSFIEISKIFSLNHETLEDTNNIDEMVRYTSYQDFDFISMSFGTDDIKKNEINIYLNNNYLFICFPEEEIAEIKKINEILEKRITSSTKIRHTAIVRCIYDLFDSIILEYSNILEMTEDQVEELQREISSNHKKFNLDKIDIIRKKTFFMRKQLRAMEKLQGFIDNESIK
jgi:Mg2+ and Co2+ transporter CorA